MYSFILLIILLLNISSLLSLCPLGYYYNTNSICAPCTIGKYSNDTASTTCISCDIGYSSLYSSYKCLKSYISDTLTTSNTNSLSISRYYSTALSNGYKIYIAGGLDSIPYNRVDIYDSNSNTWSTSNSLSIARYALTSTSVDDAILLFAGGLTISSSYSNIVDIYNAQLNLWLNTTFSIGRAFLTSTSSSSIALFAGGQAISAPSSIVDIYNSSYRTWSTTSLSIPRAYLSSASVGSVALFAGGLGSSISDVVDIFSYSTLTWTSGVSLYQSRYSLVAVSVGTIALFAGGFSSGYSNIVDIYDATENLWTSSLLSVGRTGLAASSLGCKAFFVGGFLGTASNVVDIYDIFTKSWSQSVLSQARYRLVSATIANSLLIIGGVGITPSAKVDTFVYCPLTGSILNGVSCTCTVGSLITSKSCIVCSASGSIVADNSCSCPIGSYASLSDTICNACSSGKYTWSYGLTACLNCPSSSTLVSISANNSLITGRRNHKAVVLGSKAFFGGGDIDGVASSVVEIYDSSSTVWNVSTLSIARTFLTATSISSSLVLFAGGLSLSGVISKAVDIYFASNNSWVSLDNGLSLGRQYLASFSSATLGVFGGGLSNIGDSTRIDYFNSSSNTWAFDDQLSIARYSLSGISTLLVGIFAGGRTGDNSNSTAVDIYTFATNSWTSNLTALSVGRSSIGTTSLGPFVFFAGGFPKTDLVNIYDSVLNIWTSTSMSLIRDSVSAVSFSCKAIFSGGTTGSIIDIYDISTRSWSTNQLAFDRISAAVASVGSNILFTAGYLNLGPSNLYLQSIELFAFCSTVGQTLINGVCKCPYGQYDDGSNCVCPTGSIAISGVCSCPPGTYFSPSSPSCLSCSSGNYAINYGSTSCTSTCPISASITSSQTPILLSSGRSYLASASIGSLAIFAGGVISDSTFSNVIDILDISTGILTASTLSVARCLISGITVGAKVLFAGGFSTEGFSRVVDIYNSIDNSWSALPTGLSLGGSSFATCANGNLALFVGGVSSIVVNFYNLTSNSWSNSNSLNVARSQLAAVTVGSLGVFAGGWNGLSTTYTNVDIYSFELNQWTYSVYQLTSMHLKKSILPFQANVTAVISASIGPLAIFVDQLSTSISMDIYDSTANSWTTISTPFSFANMSAVATSGCKFIFLGGIGDSSIVIFDSYLKSWTSLSTAYLHLTSRVAFSSAIVGSTIIIAGGSFIENYDVVSAEMFSYCTISGSILVNGTCQCPLGASILDGSCQCPFGMIVNNTMCTCPIDSTYYNGVCFCPLTQYNNGTQCVSCPVGTVSPPIGSSRNSSCIICSTSIIDGICQCRSGTYGNGTLCTNCLSGYISPSGSLTSSACTPCITGRYVSASKSTCAFCPQGTFSTTPLAANSTICLSCPASYFSIFAGSTTASQCIFCPRNSVVSSGSNSPLISQRNSLASASVGNILVLAGGYNYNFLQSSGNNAEIFDLSTRTWLQNPLALSGNVGNLAATSIKNIMIFAGGWNSTLVNYYNPITNVWSANLYGLSVGRSNFAGSTLNDLAIFAGGAVSGEGLSADVFNVTTGNWTIWTSSLSCSRSYLSSNTVGDKLIFAGGDLCQSTVDIYDYKSNTWSSSSLPFPRFLHSCTSVGTLLLCGGGQNAAGIITNQVDIYDSSLNIWSTSAFSVARHSLASASIGCKAIFAGGKSDAILAVVDIYDVSTKSWFSPTTGLCAPRYLLTASVVGSIVIFAGGYNNDPAVNVVDYFSFDCVSGSTVINGACLCPFGMSNNGTACVRCSAGKYSGVLNGTCISCPPGKFSSSSGYSACTSCNSGYYAPVNSTVCASCMTGYSCPPNSAAPVICSLGSYSSSDASASCTTCSFGYYNNVTGLTISTCSGPCYAGYYCLAGATTPYQNICPLGTYSISGSSVCTNCQGGSYGNATGLTTANCTGLCAAGYYCPSGSSSATQTICYTGYCSSPGSSVCIQCVPWTGCGHGGCTYFGFNNSQIFIPISDSKIALINHVSWSIQLNFRMRSLVSYSNQYLFSKPGTNFYDGINKETNFEFAIRVNSDSILQFLMGCSDSNINFGNYARDGTSYYSFINATTINDTNWHSLIVTYDVLSQVSIYLDTISIVNSTNFGICSPLFGGSTIFLGSGSIAPGFNASYFYGDMMDVRLWGYAIGSNRISDYIRYASAKSISYQSGLLSMWLLDEGGGISINEFRGISNGYASSPTWGREDHSTPFVINIYPVTVNDIYSTGYRVTIAVVFTEPVIVTGNPILYLQIFPLNSTSGVIAANYDSGSKTSTLYFVYIPSVSHYTTNLITSPFYTSLNMSSDGATITDLVGNPAETSIPSTGILNTLGFRSNNIQIGCPNCTKPDSTSRIRCPFSAFAGTTFTCIITASRRSANVSVVPNSVFTMSYAGSSNVNGVFSILTPVISYISNITVNFTTTNTSSGVILISDGVSEITQSIQIYKPVLNAVLCGKVLIISAIGRKGSNHVITNVTHYKLSDSNSNGTFTTPKVIDIVAGVVTFNFTVGQITGPTLVTDGFSKNPVTLSVFKYPDSTSSLSCPTVVTSNLTYVNCTITSRLSGQSIWTLSTFFSLSDASNGTFGMFYNAFGINLKFPYYPPPNFLGGVTQISDGLSASAASITIVRVPDSSSNITCDYLAIPGATVTCTIIPRWHGKNILAYGSYFTPSIRTIAGTTSGSVSSGVSSSIGSSFDFSFSISLGSYTGLLSISDGVKVTLIPDSTSFLKCPDTYLLISTPATCFIIPRQLGVQIYTSSFYFSPVDRLAGGSFSRMIENYANNFTVVFTPSAVDGPTFLAIGTVPPFSVQSFNIWSNIDSTSVITCDNFVLKYGVPTSCTFIPKRSSQIVNTLSNLIILRPLGATVTSLSPAFSNSFTFTYIANETGLIPLYNSAGSPALNFQIWDTPDATTIVSCPDVLRSGTIISCTIVPMRNGQQIWTVSTFFPLSDSIGSSNNSFSVVSPAYGNFFTFFYTAPSDTAPINISVAFNFTNIQIYDMPDNTTSLSCPGDIQLGSSVICTILTKRQNSAIFTYSSSFNFSYSGAGGSFSALDPYFSNRFTFNFTANMETGSVSINSGIGNNAILLIWDLPDSTSSESC